MSYGTSSYGYDIRCTKHFKISTPSGLKVTDPKKLTGEADTVKDYYGDVCVIEPGSFVLASSVETIRVPRNILVLCFGKSTYARCGIGI